MNGRSCALCRCPPTNPDLRPSSASERGAQEGRGRRRRSWASCGWRAGSRSCCSPSPSWIPCPLPLSRPGPRCEAGSRRPGRAAVSDRPPQPLGPPPGRCETSTLRAPFCGGRRILRCKSWGSVPSPLPSLDFRIRVVTRGGQGVYVGVGEGWVGTPSARMQVRLPPGAHRCKCRNFLFSDPLRRPCRLPPRPSPCP